MKRLIILSLIALGALSCSGAKSKYLTPGEIWPDNNGVAINAHGGGILQDVGKYYWYGEHKIEGREGNRAQEGVHCYSSDNLYDWRDEGIALAVSNDPSSPIAKGCIIERPKVIYNEKSGKYVMWFHFEPLGEGYSGAMSGVAVGNSADGEFEFIGVVRPNAGYYPINVQSIHMQRSSAIGQSFDGGSLPAHPDSLNLVGRDFEHGQMARDMNLFVDDDGSAYHIYSSEENSTLHIAALSDDYLSHSGKYIRLFPGRFMEAPAMFKRNGKYYLIMSGCTGWAPNAARSAVADSIFGEWKELGNPCVGEGAQTTFESQSTYVLNVGDKYIYMGDRWSPDDAIDGRYIWLPIDFNDNGFTIEWVDEWQL